MSLSPLNLSSDLFASPPSSPEIFRHEKMPFYLNVTIREIAGFTQARQNKAQVHETLYDKLFPNSTDESKHYLQVSDLRLKAEKIKTSEQFIGLCSCHYEYVKKHLDNDSLVVSPVEATPQDYSEAKTITFWINSSEKNLSVFYLDMKLLDKLFQSMIGQPLLSGHPFTYCHPGIPPITLNVLVIEQEELNDSSHYSVISENTHFEYEIENNNIINLVEPIEVLETSEIYVSILTTHLINPLFNRKRVCECITAKIYTYDHAISKKNLINKISQQLKNRFILPFKQEVIKIKEDEKCTLFITTKEMETIPEENINYHGFYFRNHEKIILNTQLPNILFVSEKTMQATSMHFQLLNQTDGAKDLITGQYLTPWVIKDEFIKTIHVFGLRMHLNQTYDVSLDTGTFRVKFSSANAEKEIDEEEYNGTWEPASRCTFTLEPTIELPVVDSEEAIQDIDSLKIELVEITSDKCFTNHHYPEIMGRVLSEWKDKKVVPHQTLSCPINQDTHLHFKIIEVVKETLPIIGKITEKTQIDIKILSSVSKYVLNAPYLTISTQETSFEEFQKTWALSGTSSILKKIHKHVIHPILNLELYEARGIEPIKGLLLSGPSGTGKTSMVLEIAKAFGISVTDTEHIKIVKGPEILSRWVGKSESNVRNLFITNDDSLHIIAIDEIDCLIPDRTGSSKSVTNTTVAQFLTEMDGFISKKNILLIGTTNRPGAIDPAFMRDGRFDLHLKVPLPDESGRKAIFDQYLNKISKFLADDITEEAKMNFAKTSEGLSGANIKGIVRKANRKAVYHGQDKVTKADIQNQLNKLKNKNMSDLSMYV